MQQSYGVSEVVVDHEHYVVEKTEAIVLIHISFMETDSGQEAHDVAEIVIDHEHYLSSRKKKPPGLFRIRPKREDNNTL